MNIITQTPHIKKLNPKTQRAVEEKFERFDKLFDRIERCNILLKKERNEKRDNFLVEATLVVPGNDLFAKELAESFEVAAEKVCQNLESQIKKHKAKLNQKATTSVDNYIEEDELE
ncbi:MAG: ribosome-associated translation inhibitor RaiA [Bacteroidota bacterium]